MRLKDSKPNSHQPLDQNGIGFIALGKAVTVVLDDLPRIQRWAVMRSRGICTVWRFSDESFPYALTDAEATLTPKSALQKRFFSSKQQERTLSRSMSAIGHERTLLCVLLTLYALTLPNHGC